MLTSKVKQEISLHAHSVSPQECCGYIVEKNNEFFIFPCKNIALKNDIFFEISPQDYLIAQSKGDIVGVYHSQENSTPSNLDCINVKSHGLRSIVYSWKYNTFCDASENLAQFMKYVGREFEFYYADCFTLVRDFYKQEYGIQINNYFRNEDWFIKNPTIIKDNYQKEGFNVIQGEKKQGDIIIFKLAHFGIYIEKDTFLHHPHNKISTIEKLTDKWGNHIDLIVRHESR